MKRTSALCAVVAILGGLSLTGCSSSSSKNESNVLRIYNWQDYIFEGDDENDSVIDQFKDYYKEKHGKSVKVEYYTFETNETMLNVLKTGKSHYDLICPSDYTIQKMIKEGMVERIDTSLLSNYHYISPFIRNLFDSSLIENEDGEQVSWSEYAIPYMWGTMGFMYDPEKVDDETVRSWEIIWDSEYKHASTLKDSVRDTYCAAVFHVYKEELDELASQYQNGIISATDYTAKITEIMNRTDKKTIKAVEKALQEAKENIYGFEVDSGKSDIVTGKISINFCWSGDAVYSMDCAEEESDVYLNYVIPQEGSNVWFDGWVLGKNANKELAHEFLDFICRPDIACFNMNEIGYTSAVAGEEVFEMVQDWYQPEDFAELTEQEIQLKLDNEELFEVDLSYFFEGNITGDYKVYTEELDRQLSAQYPDYETVIRCAIMEDFGKANAAILEMWGRAKSDKVDLWMWILIVVSVVVVATFVAVNKVNRHVRNKRIKMKKQQNA